MRARAAAAHCLPCRRGSGTEFRTYIDKYPGPPPEEAQSVIGQVSALDGGENKQPERRKRGRDRDAKERSESAEQPPAGGDAGADRRQLRSSIRVNSTKDDSKEKPSAQPVRKSARKK